MSALHPRPARFYFAIVSVLEYGVTHKIRLGADFPFAALDICLIRLRCINRVAEGTAFPRIPEDVIEGIIHRDSLSRLVIAS